VASVSERTPRRVRITALALAALLITTGTLHFVTPDAFEGIVPRFLGSPAFWVAASGVAELGCAALLAVGRTRRLGGWAACALFVAVYPANITMAVHALQGDGSVWIALLRLPLQVPLVFWAYWIGTDGQLRWPVSFSSRTDEFPSSQ
jgi:uncharacterized membrane protein